MSFFKKWLTFVICAGVFLMPATLLKGQLLPWSEAVFQLEAAYPDSTLIDIGGTSQVSLSGSYKKRRYLILPETEIIVASKRNEREVKLNSAGTEQLWYLSAGVLVILGLFATVVFQYVSNRAVKNT